MSEISNVVLEYLIFLAGTLVSVGRVVRLFKELLVALLVGVADLLYVLDQFKLVGQ